MTADKQFIDSADKRLDGSAHNIVIHADCPYAVTYSVGDADICGSARMRAFFKRMLGILEVDRKSVV